MSQTTQVTQSNSPLEPALAPTYALEQGPAQSSIQGSTQGFVAGEVAAQETAGVSQQAKGETNQAEVGSAEAPALNQVPSEGG